MSHDDDDTDDSMDIDREEQLKSKSVASNFSRDTFEKLLSVAKKGKPGVSRSHQRLSKKLRNRRQARGKYC